MAFRLWCSASGFGSASGARARDSNRWASLPCVNTFPTVACHRRSCVANWSASLSVSVTADRETSCDQSTSTSALNGSVSGLRITRGQPVLPGSPLPGASVRWWRCNRSVVWRVVPLPWRERDSLQAERRRQGEGERRWSWHTTLHPRSPSP